MKKTSFKKLLSMTLSLVLVLSVIASISITAAADDSALDLGDSFVATIVVPALEKNFSRDGANVVTAAADDSDAQLWTFEKIDASNAYRIVSELDGRFLAVQGDLSAALANVYAAEEEQAFYIKAVGDKVVIQPVGAEGKVVDVNGVDFNVQYWSFNEANTCQQFNIVKVGAEDDTTGDDETADDTTGDDEASGDATEAPEASKEVNYAAGKKYTTTTNGEAPAYLGGKADTDEYLLTDGVIPEAEIGGETVAFQGTSAANAVTINLGKKYTDINKIVFGGVRIDGNRQFTQVIVEVSTNGTTFTKVDSASITREDEEIATGTYNVTLKLSKKITAKYVKVTMISSAYVLAVSEIQVIGNGAAAGGNVDAGESENPGDAGYVVVALVAAISLAGAVLVSKRKFN